MPGGPLVCGYCGEEGRFGSTSAAGILDGERQINPAAELAKAAVIAMGGQGAGGRPDFAQGGAPDGSKAAEGMAAVKAAISA